MSEVAIVVHVAILHLLLKTKNFLNLKIHFMLLLC